MNIRDNIEVCGYCGGKIAKESEESLSGSGRHDSSGSSGVQKGTGKFSKSPEEEPDSEEEEGGISVYLQPGEKELIGSLNIAVKKFFFHAYLTNQRVFLIDTQEKKVKVTAKDIPRDTIAASSIEYSESSDPVLVLSLKSADDEIKTMKLIFIQNGMDRSDEIHEWLNLLQEQGPVKKSMAAIEEPPEYREEPVLVQAEKALQKQELQPKRKPAKDHEKQPPVKRHILFHKMEEEEEARVEETQPPRRSHVREVPQPVKRPVMEQESYEDISSSRRADTQPLRKREVQSAMKVAMKNAMQPLKPSTLQSVKKPVTERASTPSREPERDDTDVSPRRSTIQEKPPSAMVVDEGAELPSFCQNCGKKIPPAANFCPGCGAKLVANRAGFSEKTHETPREKKMTSHEGSAREKKGAVREEERDEEKKGDESQVPTKPPVKKGPKGSEMTILHKFLRR
jgi:hypothetical protein